LGKRNVPLIRERADVIHVFVSAIVNGALDRLEPDSARRVARMCWHSLLWSVARRGRDGCADLVRGRAVGRHRSFSPAMPADAEIHSTIMTF
jgi:hypothetical protein